MDDDDLFPPCKPDNDDKLWASLGAAGVIVLFMYFFLALLR